MDVYTLFDTRTWYVVICCGVVLVLTFYALALVLMTMLVPRRAHLVPARSHQVWMPEPHQPVPGKPGLYSAPGNR